MRIDATATIVEGLARLQTRRVLPVAGVLVGSVAVASYGTLAAVVLGLSTALLSRQWWLGGATILGILALWVGAAVLTLAGQVVAARCLGPSVPTADRGPFRRRIGRATLSTVAIAVVLTPFAIGGTLLAVLPGVAVLTLGGIATVTVAIEDRSALDALGRAWALAGTDRQATAVIGAVVGAATFVMVLGSLFAIVVPVIGGLLRAALLTVGQLALLGILVEAVVRLREIHDYDASV